MFNHGHYKIANENRRECEIIKQAIDMRRTTIERVRLAELLQTASRRFGRPDWLVCIYMLATQHHRQHRFMISELFVAPPLLPLPCSTKASGRVVNWIE